MEHKEVEDLMKHLTDLEESAKKLKEKISELRREETGIELRVRKLLVEIIDMYDMVKEVKTDG